MPRHAVRLPGHPPIRVRSGESEQLPGKGRVDAMTTMIAVEDLSRRFGHLLAVDGISLTVDRGEVLGILGPNGSGKSTTMKMVTGFLAPSAGSVEVCGIDVAVDPVAAQRRLGYLPEGAPAYGDITTAAYLRFIADVRRLFGAAGRRAIEDVVERTNIAPVLHQPIETLSKGFKRRVGLTENPTGKRIRVRTGRMDSRSPPSRRHASRK